MALLNSDLSKHLDKVCGGSTNYTVSGVNATFPSASFNEAQLLELIEKARASAHVVSLASGVLTIKPR